MFLALKLLGFKALFVVTTPFFAVIAMALAALVADTASPAPVWFSYLPLVNTLGVIIIGSLGLIFGGKKLGEIHVLVNSQLSQIKEQLKLAQGQRDVLQSEKDAGVAREEQKAIDKRDASQQSLDARTDVNIAKQEEKK